MFQEASAAVLLAVEYQQNAQFVAMAALGVVHGPFQAGGDTILSIGGKREGKDDATTIVRRTITKR